MIANFFNKTKPINFVVLFGLMFIVYLIGIIKLLPVDISLDFFIKKNIYLFLNLLFIFFINFIIKKNTLTNDNSYAILFFVIMFGFFSNSFFNKNIFIANFILLFAFRRIYSLRSSLNTKQKIFDSAFWIGFSSLFYSWSLLYLFLLYLSIGLFKKSNTKNLLIPALGLITPIYIYYSYLLLIDKPLNIYKYWQFDLSFEFSVYNSIKFLFPIGFLLILTIISIFPTTKKSLQSKLDFKSTWFILIAHISLSIIIALLAPNKDGSEFLFLFFPLGILFANFLQGLNRYWVKEMIIYLFLSILILTSII